MPPFKRPFKRRSLLAALLLALPCQPLPAAETLRCGSRVVSTGARAVEVEALCGAPDYRDVWAYSWRGRSVADREEWYYNFGPNQLLRILRFDNGRLARIDSEGYGFTERGDASCRPSEIVEGLSKYRLLARCGEPDAAEQRQLLVPLPPHRGGHGAVHAVEPVYREHWLYDFGANYLQREVTLENGRVRRVESGRRGFIN